jgi:hypothetical protein
LGESRDHAEGVSAPKKPLITPMSQPLDATSIATQMNLESRLLIVAFELSY